jgi:hypothetical protein
MAATTCASVGEFAVASAGAGVVAGVSVIVEVEEARAANSRAVADDFCICLALLPDLRTCP